MLKVSDVMTRDVVTVAKATPIKDVAKLLVEHAISGMPVVDERGAVVGVVSEGDLVIKEQGADAVERRPLARIFGNSAQTEAQLAKVGAVTAGDAMTAPAITISEDAPIAEAATTMARRRVNRLPVMDGDALVGLLTRADIVRVFARPDEELAETIRQDVVYRTLWLDPGLIDVTVAGGNVQLRGQVERRSEADMLERVTAMVPGVVGVSADLTWKLDDRDIEAPRRDLLSPYRP